MSGGLDNQLKVYDTTDYKVTQNMKFPAPVIAAQLSPDKRHLVVGMSNGLLAIRRRDMGGKDEESRSKGEHERLTTGSYRYFMRGRVAAIPAEAHRVGSSAKKVKLREWDVYLKKFQYQNALDAVVSNASPSLICSVMEELARRDGLKIALHGRTAGTLEPVLRFVARYISNPRYTAMLVVISNLLLDLYASVVGHSAAIDSLLSQLRSKIEVEVKMQKELLKLEGIMEMLMAGNTRKAQAT